MPPDHLPADVLSPPRAISARRLLSAILPAAVLVPAASTVIAVALPAIIDDFGMTHAAIGWLVTAYLVLMAVLQTPAGRLGDRVGHRRVLATATGLLAVSCGGAALATTPSTLVGARLVQGLAAAGIVPSGLALLRRHVTERARDRMLGRLLAGMTGGAILGVTAGGALVAAGSWRAPFFALGLIAGAALPLAMTAPARSAHPPVDTAGKPRRPGRWRAVALPAAGIAFANLAVYVVLLVVPLRGGELGWSSAASGMLLGAFVAAAAIGMLAEARLSGRLGRLRTLPSAAGAVAVALLAVTAVPTVLSWLVPLLVVAGAGLGVATSGLFTIGLGAAGPDAAGHTAGLLSTARYVGSIVGSAALPALLAIGGHTAGLLLAAGAAMLIAPLVAGRQRRHL